jgi:membrane-associated two-gene conflict system component 1 (EACC1)
MRVEVVVAVDDGGVGVRSLYRWLVRDPDVRRSVPVSLEPGSGEGFMGALEVIGAVLSQATAIGTLVVAIASWRDSRAEPARVTITVGEGSVTIGGETAEQAEVMIRALLTSGSAIGTAVDGSKASNGDSGQGAGAGGTAGVAAPGAGQPDVPA